MFAERMKELREFTEPRLKQEDVGKLLNMSQRKISRLETGAVNPTPEEIVKICKFYKVSADYILGLTNDINK
ncbi:helix-turn-helix transcriptional regulator [uncultured Eubacterium sp.]|uniref:helix-turn-helix domain-containing protein n=1 Tax=uncultured Eubacterium sp. TaxID=165185 RepID=UPI0025DF0DE1|nr:helix-turn-helix transcriptional regulator [uncultured Eubacterium sp.]